MVNEKIGRKRLRPTITAIVYDKKGRVLSIARNSYVKTHPLQAKIAREVGEPSKIYLHAEIAALIKVKDWNDAYRIAVFRYGADGRPRNAKPCGVCQRALHDAGIEEITHT